MVLLVLVSSLALVLVQCGTVRGQSQIEYDIRIYSNGASSWIILQSGTGSQITLDTFTQFQNKINSLVSSAENQTGRVMSANFSSIVVDYSGSYTVVKYQFGWANFSRIDGGRILIGDVFGIKDFFTRLFGDGAVYMTYPSQYVIDSVSPPPYEQNASTQTLHWIGTTDFSPGQPSIVLRQSSAPPILTDVIRQYAVLIASLLLAAAGISAGFYMFKHREKGKAKALNVATVETANISALEDNEAKILKLLRSSGGNLRQSAISEQCEFSRAKTSQVLTGLEKKGAVKRYKKGRDKVVILQLQQQKTDGESVQTKPN